MTECSTPRQFLQLRQGLSRTPGKRHCPLIGLLSAS
jgi:hypothetical protein